MKRMVFNKIKKDVLLKSIKDAGEIDLNLVDSQKTRQILDRIIGFTASPFLMNFFGPKLSAGRVQSVVTRMVIDREREIEKFVPEDFWTIQTQLTTDKKETFLAKYTGRLNNLADAEATKMALNKPDYLISEVVAEEEKRFPQAPLVTSTLQRVMSRDHSFEADRTMKAAQSLYESGYVSYIRTDSVRVADEDIENVRKWLTDNNKPIPKKSHSYKNKDAAQDAHECIHPTDLTLLPNQNYAIINPDEKAVYKVIWDYFVASQMTPAVYDTLNVTAHTVGNPKVKVKASGKALKSEGYLNILGFADDSKIDIPNLKVGDIVHLEGKLPLRMEKKSTQPPPRFSQDKLIKELDSKNIGRPATYADLLSKITTRNYVEKKGNVYHATALGKKITDVLTGYFSFLDYNYTAKMEKMLDDIGSGKVKYLDMLGNFYPNYKKELDKAYLNNGGNLCELCGSPMAVRTVKSNNSKFLACSAYPKCRNTKNLD